MFVIKCNQTFAVEKTTNGQHVYLRPHPTRISLKDLRQSEEKAIRRRAN